MADNKIIFSMVGVSKTFPPNKQVLKNIYLSFFYGAKIGIIGLNGSGKSTLLKIIAGLEESFDGEVHFTKNYSIGLLEQEPHMDDTKTVKEIIQEGAQEVVDILKEYEEAVIRDFKYSKEEVKKVLTTLFSIFKIVEPEVKLKIVEKDPEDNKILECALFCNA